MARKLFQDAARVLVTVRHRGMVYECDATSLEISVDASDGLTKVRVEAVVLETTSDPTDPDHPPARHAPTATEVSDSVARAEAAFGDDEDAP